MQRHFSAFYSRKAPCPQRSDMVFYYMYDCNHNSKAKPRQENPE